MSSRRVTNLSASIRQRLLNRAREREEDFQLTLTRFGLERLLYRLSRSEYSDRFVLKGAMLFTLWSEDPYRPTRDLDLAVIGDSSTEGIRKIFEAVTRLEVEPDGLQFMPDTIRADQIREGSNYDGVRVRLEAVLDSARIPLQVDIGFGDAITPAPIEITYPTLLDLPSRPPSRGGRHHSQAGYR